MSYVYSIVSAAKKDEIITFHSEDSVLKNVILEAVKKDLISLSGNCTRIKIFHKNDEEPKNTYFYSLIISNGKKFIMPIGITSFEKNIKFPDGILFNVSDVGNEFKGTPFYGFEKREWKKFFSIVEKFTLLHKQYTREEILEILDNGGSIIVNELHLINRPSSYIFKVVPH